MPAPVTFRQAAPEDIETLLCLIRAYRRQGVGRAALMFLEKIAPELAVVTLELQAERHNEAALAFYMRALVKDRLPDCRVRIEKLT